MAGMRAMTRTVVMIETGEVRTFPWLVPPSYKRSTVRRSIVDMPLQRTIKVTSNLTGETIWQEEDGPQ